MARTVTARAFDATLSVKYDSFRGCCGAIELFYFSAEGCAHLLQDKINHLYALLEYELFDRLNCGDNAKAIGVAADALPEHMSDEEAAWADSDYKREGEVCLANFCRHMGWAESEVGINGNTDNGVAFFTGSFRDEDGQRTVPRPVFSGTVKEEKKDTVPTSDRDEIIKRLTALAGA